MIAGLSSYSRGRRLRVSGLLPFNGLPAQHFHYNSLFALYFQFETLMCECVCVGFLCDYEQFA